MHIAITAGYAAILALIVLALAINVTRHRVKFGVSIGDGGNPHMLRMIRLHGNAIEYIPLALVLMLIYEINGGAHIVLHIIGIALLAARLVQTWGMWSTATPGFARRTGQSLTWLTLAALAVANLWQAL
jgi:uncharacterized protein